MTITAIILSHYKEREGNLKRIVDDLLAGTVKPSKIIIIIDNPDIKYEDERATIISSDKTFLPIIRFAIGSICDTDYCFFIDDDIGVRSNTLYNFTQYADEDVVLGLEGNRLAEGNNPYTKGETFNRNDYGSWVDVDIIIRTYFVSPKICGQAIRLFSLYKDLPRKNVDDVYLCLSSQHNYIIPVNEQTDITELGECGVGQSYDGEHYKNRDLVCKELR